MMNNCIKNCNTEGELMMCVSKLVPTSDKGQNYAFGPKNNPHDETICRAY